MNILVRIAEQRERHQNPTGMRRTGESIDRNPFLVGENGIVRRLKGDHG